MLFKPAPPIHRSMKLTETIYIYDSPGSGYLVIADCNNPVDVTHMTYEEFGTLAKFMGYEKKLDD